MNAIDAKFGQLRGQRRKAFIPFVTAGDPDIAATERLVEELVRRGSSLIEIGFPYSDPIADGSVIQASYNRVLARGIRLNQVYSAARRLSESPQLRERGVPLVAMVSYSIVHREGPKAFLAHAQEAGFSGAIVPDLPIEESEYLASLAASRDFKLIQLVTPTTPPERAARIARTSTGFLYCVSVTGITGERERLPEELLGQLGRLRELTDLPLCVGFGINTPEHVRMLRDAIDGVIVGSAIVRRLEQSKPLEEIVSDVGRLAQDLIHALEEDGAPVVLQPSQLQHEGTPPDRA